MQLKGIAHLWKMRNAFFNVDVKKILFIFVLDSGVNRIHNGRTNRIRQP